MEKTAEGLEIFWQRVMEEKEVHRERTLQIFRECPQRFSLVLMVAFAEETTQAWEKRKQCLKLT